MVVCVLCQKSEETVTTGPLSTKESLTAHQNCLLYSSGIYCQYSPEFDDLFGFSVEDVMNEVKRGNKLYCHHCKKKGATAGCEVKHCKRTYHYPCAVQVGAKVVEDEAKGKYTLYCCKHSHQVEGNNDTRNGQDASFSGFSSPHGASEIGSSKVCCLTCEKKEGNISLESLNNSIIMCYCAKHAPSSHKKSRNNPKPSVDGNDSASSILKRLNFKRKMTSTDGHEGRASKHTCEKWRKKINSDSESDEEEPNSDLAPIESDPDESAGCVSEHQFIRRDANSPAGSTSGNRLAAEKEDETFIESDADSESILREHACMESDRQRGEGCSRVQSPSKCVRNPGCHAAESSVPQQSPAEPSPTPDVSKPASPPSPGPAGSSSPPGTSCVPAHSSPTPSPHSYPPSPMSLPLAPELTLDATSFWKSCNAAGCTEAIFSDFISNMNKISSRIQSDQASEEDYNVALKVIMSSGKLTDVVSKQHAELKKKQTQLRNAAAAMEKIVSALR